MYDDRLEIINPGILHYGMTPEKLMRPHESKPWNPIIASVFYRAGIIEKWGTGTLNILTWCKENGNPPPFWEVRTQSVVVSFAPSVFFNTGKTAEELQPSPTAERPESRPESIDEKILSLLQKGPLSKGEISKKLGHHQISGAVKKALVRLINEEQIIHTIPEKPNSRLQKYKLKR